MRVWPRISEVYLNFMSREIALKIVYFGPRGAGVSENLDRIHPRRGVPTRGLVLDVPGPSVPSFDLLIGDVTVRGFGVRE
jgi:hypothetical protein